MNVLVTGGYGFIGSHLVERLLSQGVAVRVLSHRPDAAAPFAGWPVERVEGDLRDAEAVWRATRGCERVYHLAAKPNLAAATRRTLFDVNRTGTGHVVQAAVACGVKRLVYCSTCGIYGIPRRTPAGEETPAAPNTPYRSSKWEGEQIALRAMHDRGLGVVIARPVSVCGPRGRNWLGLWRAIAAGGFRIIGPGRNRIHFTDVSDVVDGLIACGERPGIEGESFNLVSTEAIAVGRLIEEMARYARAPLARRPSPAWPFRLYHRLDDLLYRAVRLQLPRAHAYEMFVVDRVFSTAKANARLGWTSRFTPEQSLERMVNWYREAGIASA